MPDMLIVCISARRTAPSFWGHKPIAVLSLERLFLVSQGSSCLCRHQTIERGHIIKCVVRLIDKGLIYGAIHLKLMLRDDDDMGASENTTLKASTYTTHLAF